MAVCPACGKEVKNVVEKRLLLLGKGIEAQQISLGLFECPECKTRFRQRIEANDKQNVTTTLGELVKKVVGIREGLTQSLETLRDRLRMLETERMNLLSEIAELKKAAESRASLLENEIRQLREEKRTLMELLGYESPKAVTTDA